MGVLLSMCKNEDPISRDELYHTIEKLQKEVKLMNTVNIVSQEKNKRLQEDLDAQTSQVRDLKRKCRRYTSHLKTDVENTADILMKSTIHLEYLDDRIEKNHICDVLIAVYELVNK